MPHNISALELEEWKMFVFFLLALASGVASFVFLVMVFCFSFFGFAVLLAAACGGVSAYLYQKCRDSYHESVRLRHDLRKYQRM